VRDEFVKLRLSNKVLKVEQEVKALLVRDTGECIIGILTLQIHNEFSELVVVTEMLDSICQRLPSNDG
jgi:hypothetical protein